MTIREEAVVEGRKLLRELVVIQENLIEVHLAIAAKGLERATKLMWATYAKIQEVILETEAWLQAYGAVEECADLAILIAEGLSQLKAAKAPPIPLSEVGEVSH